jgi:myo-inositol 2-dehydrogenase/D-chiro-inositol 1-dehydrogenase
LLESASGVHVDIEVFVNCGYGYDVACELVGETGTIRLTEPADVEVRSAGSRAERITADWRERFVRAYDSELAAWLASVSDGTASGPSAWDGYAAAMVSDACVRALHSGDRTVVTLSDKPPFYA